MNKENQEKAHRLAAIAQAEIDGLQFDISLCEIEAKHLERVTKEIDEHVKTVDRNLPNAVDLFDKWSEIASRYGALFLTAERLKLEKIKTIKQTIEKLMLDLEGLEIPQDEWPEFITDLQTDGE